MGSPPGNVNWLSVQGLLQPTSQEFLKHPDYRQISAFFLGWVFLYAIVSLVRSRFLAGPYARVQYWVGVTGRYRDEGDGLLDEKSERIGLTGQGQTDFQPQHDNAMLNFTLFLCQALASVAYFVSLLTFDLTGGDTACAFFSAWGFMAAKSILLVGLLALSLELRRLGVQRMEAIAVWAFLAVAIALVFATAAVATGFTSTVIPLGFALCSKRYFLPTSVVASLIFIFVETYVILRLYMRVGTVRDVRAFRAITLLILTLLTMVPDAVPTNTLANFVPFSIAACLVLAAFNSRPLVVRNNTSMHTIGEPTYIEAARSRSPSLRAEPLPATSSNNASYGNNPLPSSYSDTLPFPTVVPPSQRGSVATRKSIPPPLQPVSQQSAYVPGPLREEFNAFQSPIPQTARSAGPQTARSNNDWVNEGPMVSAFQTSGLALSPSLVGNSAAQMPSRAQTPAMLRAERVVSTVPIVSNAPWRQSNMPGLPGLPGPVRKIVPNQVQFARELDAEDAARTSRSPPGPRVPPVPRPKMTVDVKVPAEPQQPTAGTRDSAIFGSDIIRNASARKDKMKRRSSWGPSVAPVEDSEGTTSPVISSRSTTLDRTASRRSVSSTIASAVRGHRRASSIGSIPPMPLPMPPFGEFARSPPFVSPSAVTDAQPSRAQAMLPTEIAALATQPLRIVPRSQSVAVRGPRPPPVSPPPREGARSTPNYWSTYLADVMAESPESSPVRETGHDGADENALR